MKLRNKKTGEIGEVGYLGDSDGKILVNNINDLDTIYEYDSLAEFNVEWEDYEEPEGYWYIDYDGGILCGEKDNSSAERMMISMGNHFESLEEAEKAVEKLKAVKRLKDKGFKFVDFNRVNDCASLIRATFDESWSEIYDDLNTCFGGEE